MAMGMSRERVKVLAFLFNDTEDAQRIDVDSFLRAFKLTEQQMRFVNVHQTVPTLSMLDGVHAVVIGGSKLSVWEEVPNGASLAEVVKAARAKKLPTIGVCFGAQFLAHIFGGKVVRDVAKEERGTFEITTSDDSFTDLLFADAPFTFKAQCAHHDCITTPPTGAVVLASSELCPVQAFSIPGTDVYGVQFHPERSKEDYERSLALRGQQDPSYKQKADAIAAHLEESPDAEAILARFIDRVVLPR
jgi:GMP synthase (glutamine-hydrolysing)